MKAKKLKKGFNYDAFRSRWVRWYQYTWLGKLWYEIKRGVPALWRWRKVAWNDVDWDYSSIYTVLRFKIENTANYIEKHDRFVGATHEVGWMRRTVNLIDGVLDDTYEMEHMDYEETNFTFEDIEDKPGYSLLNSDIIKENLDDYFNKYPLCKKRAIQYIKDNKDRYVSDHNDKHLIGMVMGNLRQAKAKKLLFDIIEWRVERWWD